MRAQTARSVRRDPRPLPRNHDVVSEIYDIIALRTDGPYANRFLYHLQSVRDQLALMDEEAQCRAIYSYWVCQLGIANVTLARPRQAGKTIINREQLKNFVVRYVVNRIEELDLPRVADKPNISTRS